MPLVDVATRAFTQRLLRVAASDTGQADTAGASLLASWNAKSRGGFDLTDLWTADNTIAREMPAIAASIASRWEHAAATDLGPRLEQLVAQGRPALAGTGDA